MLIDVCDIYITPEMQMITMLSIASFFSVSVGVAYVYRFIFF